MKILKNNKIYVQKIDIEFLKYTMGILPDNILTTINLDDYEKYDFLCFTNEEDIEFFKNLECLIDYNEFENKDTDEIKETGERLVGEFEFISKSLYQGTLDSDEYKKTMKRYKELNHMITSLRDLMDYKLGLLKLNITTKKSKLKRLLNKIKRDRNETIH